VAKVLYRYDQVCKLFLGVVFALLTVFALYAGLTYSIVLTIVHYDGTSILSLHTVLTRILNIRILCISLRSSAFGINNIWQLEQYTLIKMDSLLIGHFV
jgi:hypothetical protein